MRLFSAEGSPSLPLLRTKVRKIVEGDEAIVGQTVLVQGWVRTVRDQKKFSFIEINDGSTLKGIQAVAGSEIPTYDAVGKLTTGAAAEIVGTVVASQGKGQKYEIQAQQVTLVGDCPADTYPLQKKRHSQEFLRTIAHLRARTNTISAVSRVRSALAFATHKYFQEEGFVYVQTPLITSSDCEGAGEMFRVTTLPLDNMSAIHTLPSNNCKKAHTDAAKSAAAQTAVPAAESSVVSGAGTGPAAAREPVSADFSQDFFGKPTYLTVSGQLSGETYACALGDIYTFGPTFRAENSQTSKHLAEFHMIEPEMAFADMASAMHNAESFVKYVVKHVLQQCTADLEFFEQFMDKNLKTRLRKLVELPFAKVSYTDAIALLQAEIAKDPNKWAYPDVHFGTDLQTEHERWLAEKHFNSCVFVHNYPRQIKAFYMRDNADGRTVDAFDLIVPGIGELIGGSQREERLDVLQRKMKEFKLSESDYSWYLDLRRYGTVPHAGYGLGFERLVCYVTAIDNIREAIAYPRYPGNADF